MPDSIKVRVLRSTSELQAFVPGWRRLWSSDPYATPFQSPEWLLPWWRQFGHADLRAAVMTRGEQAMCFLPLYVCGEPCNCGRKMMLMGVGTSDYLDGIYAPQCGPAEVLECLKVALDFDGWDALSLAQIRSQSKLLNALGAMARLRPFDSESCSRMHAVPIAGLSAKIRRNAMYYRNRARRRGTLQFSVADCKNCSTRFEELVQMHSARWQQAGETGVLADPRVLAWHREAVPLLQQSGILRLVSLRLGNETIATLYSVLDPPQRSARVQYFYLPAYSPAHAELRPGTLLMAEAIEDATREGVAVIDMLRGQEPYKQIWHTEQIPTSGIEVRANDWRTALHRAAA